VNLLSSVNAQGPTVTKIYHFKGGTKKVIHGVLTETIEQGQFTKYKTTDGRMILINDINVLMIEVFEEAA
jgi:hypothetical protein